MNSIFQPTCARVCESVCASPTTVTQTQQWHHLGKLYSKRFLWCHKNTLPTLGKAKRRLLLCSNDMTKDSIRSERHMWPTLHWTYALDMFNAILNAAGSPSWFLLKLKTELRPPSLLRCCRSRSRCHCLCCC